MKAKSIVSTKLAGHILMISMLGLIIVRLLVLFRVIPYQVVRGGQMEYATSLLALLAWRGVLVRSGSSRREHEPGGVVR